jgi:hypothetical protein
MGLASGLQRLSRCMAAVGWAADDGRETQLAYAMALEFDRTRDPGPVLPEVRSGLVKRGLSSRVGCVLPPMTFT